MARPRGRICLQDGLKLDLNRLAKERLVSRGMQTGEQFIRWTHPYWGEVATGLVSADMSGRCDGWLRVRIGSLNQRIILIARSRHFGGRQWYFVCPVMNRPASVLWKPPGASRFCSRRTWQGKVAYYSQFSDATNRAHLGKAKINAKLCSIGNFDSDEWDLPPKPKWMRWSTYNRQVERFDRYEAVLDDGCAEPVARLLKRENMV